VSEDRGRTFTRVGSTTSAPASPGSYPNDMYNDFLAVAYDAEGGYL